MHETPILVSILILLFAAIFVVVMFKRFHLSPLLGYLVAGAAIGEFGLGYIESKDVSFFAELGIVFLLFTIGIELTLDRLMAMRVHVFGFGSLQVLITGGIIGLIAYLCGMDANASIIIGGALALSSTAMVIGLLENMAIQSTQVGRLSLAVLLFQDFAVVPLLVLVRVFSNGEGNLGALLATSMFKAFLGMLIIFFAGRMVLRPIFKIIASTKSDELFIATTLMLVLGASFATESFHLSMALGAFIAGLLVAETEYNLQVEESIKPFKGLLMGLFFMSVGMTVNLSFIVDKLHTILFMAVGLILLKASLVVVLCRAFRFPLGASLRSGLLLASGSEFAFILFTLAEHEGLLKTDIAQQLLMVVTLSMALTPLLARFGTQLADRFDSKETSINQSSLEISDLERFVVICGFGRVGKMVARTFAEQKMNYVVIDINNQVVIKARQTGYPVYRGDTSRVDALQHMSINRAEAVIITIANDITTEKTIKAIRTACPDVPIIVRAEDLRHLKRLKKAGATSVVPETYETGLQMAAELLKSVGVSEYQISLLKNRFRAGGYKFPDDNFTFSDEADEEILEDIYQTRMQADMYIGSNMIIDEEETVEGTAG